ncbi:MAG: LysR family transcriptional regulator [Parasporobacterium sp.]|nr:LysR family transcriptional regulator [Parasporobacterium sp.]
MEFRQINYFLAVANHRNFSHAAAHLHITQPTLSQQIHELESELGVTLFTRTNRVTELTPAGQAFFKEATLLKQQYSRCLQSISPYIHNASLVLGRVRSFEPENLLSLIHQFMDKYPQIDLRFNSYEFDDLIDRVIRREVDAAFVVLPDRIRFPNVEHALVGHDRLSVIVPKKSEFGDIKSVRDPRFRELLSSPMFLDAHGYYYREVLDYLKDFSPALNIKYAENASSISINMSSYGGFSILHEKWFFRYLPRDQYTTIELPDEIGLLQVSFIYSKDNTNPCIHSFIPEVIRNFRPARS